MPTIHAFSTQFLAACVILVSAASADLVHRYDESFDTTEACDTDSTTAWWDTATGELKLPAFAMGIAGAWDSPGISYGVVASGHLAYLADGASGLQIIDILDPVNPVELGSVDTPGSAWGVVVDGSVAYVTDYTGGLQVIDVSDPAAPVLVGSADTDQALMRSAIAGDHLYAAARIDGLAVIDVSDPTVPVVLAYADTPGTAFGVALAGDLAYVADGQDGLQVVDITDPTAPVVVGSLPTDSVAYGVAVQGDLACISDLAEGLVLIDVHDPTVPVRLGVLELPDTGWDVRLDGATAHVSCASGGVTIIDVSDPTDPLLIDTIDTPGSTRGTASMGRFLLAADYNGGLQVLEVRERRETPILASILPTMGSAPDVDVDGGLACVADGSAGLIFVNVGDPLQPEILSTPGEGLDATSVLLSGNLAYVIDAGERLQVIDITDPVSTSLMGVCTPGGEGRDLALAGDVLYLAAMTSGLVAVDVTDASAPAVVGNVTTPGNAHAVALAGNMAYVADGAGGLTVVDIHDPSAPAVVGMAAASGSSRDVSVNGDLVYLASDDGALHVFDVSDPAVPILTTSLALGGEALGLSLQGDLLLVAAGSNGIQTVDLAMPDAPVHLGSYPIAGDVCRTVVVQGNIVHAAFVNSGLVLCEVFTRAFQVDSNRARSLPLTHTEHEVQRVRLSTVQTDSIRWEITTATGDYTFAEFPADSTWQKVSPGEHLRWQAHLFVPGPGDGPTCQDLTLEWLYDTAVLDSLVDTPDDQSGMVQLNFTRSGFDFEDELDSPVTSYGIWRRIGDAAAGGVRTELPPGNWEYLFSVAAAQQDTYQVNVPTVQDSVMAVYCVSTHTTVPALWFCTPPDSAFSFDDLAPAVPTGLELTSPELLTWDDPIDEDFDHFSVYGSTSPELDDEAVVLGDTFEPQFDVTGAVHDYFLVTALDSVGNESAAAVLQIPHLGVPDVPPSTLALGPATPNPFNPRTTLHYATPARGHVRLKVVDLVGRLVATLVDEVLPAGRHDVVWDGRDADGREVPSGVYLSHLESGGEIAHGRMTLVR